VKYRSPVGVRICGGGPGVQGPLSGRVPREVQPGPVRGGGQSELRLKFSAKILNLVLIL
jgi:hypothetical protein